ncbi:NUDIX domain-containing protein [Halegenticoccus tardaugens]|uniref:NUDIX domain-containing protein n=1 Tax=Halegenticoccus tardaugens TaxID=2071624 RepID=UPI00100B18FB|nr:NUDIX domain-containing protein [Halegenticoccus tardaugens]
MARAHVVTAFLRHRGEVLLVRRSDAVGTYAGKWGGVSGYVEGDPADALADARRETAEEVGVRDATLVRAGDPLPVDDGDHEWIVHPFLFRVSTRGVTLNEELADAEWVQPPEILSRATVPALWEAYERVAPTVETVRADEEHGSAYVSVRALEVLRDRAAVAADWDEVAAVARDLRDARPSMAALGNRVNRAMAEADEVPEAVLARAAAAVTEAVAADGRAAANAAEILTAGAPAAEVRDGTVGTVVTLSRSGTVTDALLRADPSAVVVAESRPAREGVGVAEELADEGIDATLTTDAAIPYVLAEEGADAALVGADAVLSDGSVVNKVGTRALGLAAAREGVPLYVVAARDKVSPDDAFRTEFGDPADVSDGPTNGERVADRSARVDVLNPIFDRTDADLVTGIVTEDGALDAEGVRTVAAEHRRSAEWDDEGTNGFRTI